MTEQELWNLVKTGDQTRDSGQPDDNDLRRYKMTVSLPKGSRVMPFATKGMPRTALQTRDIQ